MRVPTRRAAVSAALAVVALGIVYLVLVVPLRSLFRDDDGAGPPGPAAGTGEAAPSGAPGSRTNRPPPAASGVPMPVGDLPGWRQVFTDDFTGTTLDDSQWFRYDGQPAGDPGGWFDPSHVSVQDGKLVIGAWRELARGDLYVTGGVSNRNAIRQTYGRFEVRFRVDRGTGIAYVMLLWPSNNSYPPEIDFAEDSGRDRRTMYGVLHPPDPRFPNEEFHVDTNVTRWHTVALEWTPQRLVYILDGEPWAWIEGPQVPAESMSLAMQTQAWYCGHGWEACPDETTPERVNLEIDWVTIYLRDV